MPLSVSELTQVKRAARQLPPDAPAVRVETFLSSTLGLNPAQSAQYFPDPDPTGSLEVAIGHLTQQREQMLRDECLIPGYIIHEDVTGIRFVSGFDAYLASKNAEPRLRGRLLRHHDVRSAVRRMQNGHDVEALAAAIMNVQCDYGEATRGSGDQGIDAIGWSELVLIDPFVSDGVHFGNRSTPGEKVFLFASSKAFTDGGNGAPKAINPAHIRELVGGWSIQRSSVGMWQKVGIRMLSPVQMILVTTYRLSLDAKAECRGLGIQVWGIPELVYLICKSAPVDVFDEANSYAFSSARFRAWWRQRDTTRVMAA